MFQNWEIIMESGNTGFWLAETLASQSINSKEAAVVFSGPQFFVALIAGLLMAFAFQFLLTNLTLATGISTEESALALLCHSPRIKIRESRR